MTKIYEIKPTKQAFKEIYGKRIDTPEGCLSLLEKLIKELPWGKKKNLPENKVFNFLYNRYINLTDKKREEDKHVNPLLEKKHEDILKKIDELSYDSIYNCNNGRINMKEVRKIKDEEEKARSKTFSIREILGKREAETLKFFIDDEIWDEF